MSLFLSLSKYGKFHMNNPTPSDPRDLLDRDTVLLHWQQAKDVLETAKATEMSWRVYVVKRAFPDGNEGTNTLPLGGGYELKGVINYNYKLDKDTAKVWAIQNRIAATGNRGSFLADKFFSWKVDFLTTEYKKLLDEKDSGEAKQILDLINEVLTIDEAAPGLKIKEPKGSKK